MTTIKIKGMSCNHCVMAVTNALNEIYGVHSVQVDLASGQATFDAEKSVDIEYVKERVNKAGYEVIE